MTVYVPSLSTPQHVVSSSPRFIVRGQSQTYRDTTTGKVRSRRDYSAELLITPRPGLQMLANQDSDILYTVIAVGARQLVRPGMTAIELQAGGSAQVDDIEYPPGVLALAPIVIVQGRRGKDGPGEICDAMVAAMTIGWRAQVPTVQRNRDDILAWEMGLIRTAIAPVLRALAVLDRTAA